MKKLLTLLLALLMLCASLAACGNAPSAGGTTAPDNGIAADEPLTETPIQLPEDLPEAEPDDAPEDVLDGMPEAVTGSETLLYGGAPLDEEGWYSGRDEVALYLMAYGRLPDNFITKKEAHALGWQGGGLDDFAPGCSIGGDHFGNREGSLPAADGRRYTECDIDTQGASKRGAKRIIFSNDGLIFYTDDHYETFTLLLGEE